MLIIIIIIIMIIIIILIIIMIILTGDLEGREGDPKGRVEKVGRGKPGESRERHGYGLSDGGPVAVDRGRVRGGIEHGTRETVWADECDSSVDKLESFRWKADLMPLSRLGTAAIEGVVRWNKKGWRRLFQSKLMMS